jgi:CHAT domain-containing protein
LQVLVTAKPDRDMLLEPARSDKSIAWLGTRQPITILPSIASLKALRGQAKASRASKPYLGFGNPLLTGGDGSDRSAWTHQRCTPALLQQVARASARGIMRNATSVVRAGVVDTERLRRQPPLPETAEELCAVAAALGAEPSAVRLGEEATEARLKSLSDSGELQQARIIHIATHGMVSGETQWFAASKTEPALVLTPPAQPSGIDDGLLTASEVATLKLDADWVILSACNTAADDGSGAEALSGLARAFFYAGARSLAVSHWRVDSDATVQLITGALQALAAEPRIGRAGAMRRAMARQIAAGGHWAHPANWSPFVLAGEGSAGR